jgi:GGDEF domain-containing protein
MNRRRLKELLRDLCAEKVAKSALILFDLDGFKKINDLYGHAVGDEILLRTAERITDICPPDASCVRLGGDEFAVLLQGEDASEAAVEELMIALMATLSRPSGSRARSPRWESRSASRCAPSRARSRMAAAPRRHRDVRGEAARPEPVRAVRQRHGSRARPPHRARGRDARRDRGGRVRAVLPADHRSSHPGRPAASRCWRAGTTPSAACSSRPNSWRWRSPRA